MAEKKEKAIDVSEEKSIEQLQREILETDLLTKQFQLAEAQKRNALFKQTEEQRHLHNRQRQSELAQGRAAKQAVVDDCRHKSGGSPTNILKGGGIGSFSLLTRALMPDGVTRFIQCSRCRMGVYFRPLTKPEEKKLLKADPEKYEIYRDAKRLFEISKDNGLEHGELRGPTFFFQNAQGIPIVPEMR